MSGRSKVPMLLLLSALSFTACSDETTNVTGIGNGTTRAAPVEPAVWTDWNGSTVVRDRSTGVLSEFRFSREPGTPAFRWIYDGRTVATFNHGPANPASTSLKNGALALYDGNGLTVAEFDQGTRRLRITSPARTGALRPSDVDFDEAMSCTGALNGFFGGLTAIWWAVEKGRSDVATLLVPGVYSAWMSVESSCSWLVRQFAYEFMHPIAQIGWK